MNESFYQYGDDIRDAAQIRDYYELFNTQFTSINDTGAATTNGLVLKGIFGLLSRVGFILIQAGSIPVKNVYTIVLSNLIEISLVILSYGLIGNRLAFGSKSAGGWISFSEWKWEDITSTSSDLEGAVIGFCTCLLATAQMSSFVIGRTRLAASIWLTVIYCSIFQPFLLHWIWHEKGWMRQFKLLGLHVSVKDHSGSLVLHIPSAIFGAIGAIFLGRRIVKLKDIDRLSFGTENVVTTTIGYLLILFNYVIFSLPTAKYEDNHLPYNYSAVIVINSLLAISSGILTVTALQHIVFRHIFRYRRMIRCVQGGVAGLISIAAAVDVYSPSVTIIISTVSSIFFFFFAEVVQNTALEDSCSFISSHLVCGFIGVMLCPLVAQKENLGNTVRIRTLGVHVLWQFICTSVVIGLSVIVAVFMFLLLKILHLLRNSFEVVNHRRAIFLQTTIPKRAFFERLFTTNTTDYVMPGYRNAYFATDVGTETVKSNDATDTSFTRDEDTEKSVGLKEKGTYTSKKLATPIIQVNTSQISSQLTPLTPRQKCGCGDYHDPYLQLKTIYNPKDPAGIFRKYRGGTSWKELGGI